MLVKQLGGIFKFINYEIMKKLLCKWFNLIYKENYDSLNILYNHITDLNNTNLKTIVELRNEIKYLKAEISMLKHE